VEHSEQINEIFGALAKAQGAYEATTKDRENPHFKSSYATLASGLNAARKALAANGIGYVQSVQTEENGVNVETMLGHASGQWIRCSTFVPAAKFDAQGIGSASTYARRYAIFAMLGLAPEDDDGEDATRSMEGKNEQPPARAPRASSKKTDEPAIPYGKHKGKLPSDQSVPASELSYLAGQLETAIGNPEKARFRASNQALYGAICAELDRRAAKHAPPSGDGGNEDWGMGTGDEAEAEAMASAHD
jgi:hypothetical protein